MTATPANVSTETLAMTDAVVAWGRARFADVRVLRELVLGDRRVDVLFVLPADLVGVEIKGPKDSLERLGAQLREYRYFLPEVWVAISPGWRGDVELRYVRNLIEVDVAAVETPPRGPKETERDELCCSRLLELLWREEAARIAQRTGVIPGFVPKQFKQRKILAMLARMLTGHEIVKEVCAELRSRPLTGIGSDRPMARAAAVAKRRVATYKSG